MKKKVIPTIGFSLLLTLVVLFWVQFRYYNSVLQLSQEQTKQLAKEALNQVAEDLELRELIRYLNRESELPTRNFTAWHSKGPSQRQFYLFDDDVEIDSVRSLVSQAHAAGHDDWFVLRSLEDDKIFTENFLLSYIHKRKLLDVLMLRYLYDAYPGHDSISRFVSPKFLQQQVRKHFDSKGIYDSYFFSLHDARGNQLYEYIPTGKLRTDFKDDCVVIQRLFVRGEEPNALTPYIKLHLNVNMGRTEVMSMALPGAISTVIVLILAIFAVVMLIRQASFQSIKDSFINNMTHEFKTPVSSISLATQMLKDEGRRGETTPKQNQLISVIDMETKRLKLLIEKVLNFSILEGKHGQMPLKALDINEILLSCAEVYTLHAQRDGGDLILNLEAENTWVKGNAVHLTNTIFNLLDNASKYRRSDVPLQLKISTQSDSECIHIQIEDNGIGIPKESLRKIFERYYRVPTGNIHDVRGFGLGLAYVSSVIRALGGTIHAENTPSGGARMCIKLPLTDED